MLRPLNHCLVLHVSKLQLHPPTIGWCNKRTQFWLPTPHYTPLRYAHTECTTINHMRTKCVCLKLYKLCVSQHRFMFSICRPIRFARSSQCAHNHLQRCWPYPFLLRELTIHFWERLRDRYVGFLCFDWSVWERRCWSRWEERERRGERRGRRKMKRSGEGEGGWTRGISTELVAAVDGQSDLHTRPHIQVVIDLSLLQPYNIVALRKPWKPNIINYRCC